MERHRKRQRGGARQALYIPSSHALEALSFEAAFVWKFPIDSTGPITEGIGAPHVQRGRGTVLRADRVDGLPRIEKAREVSEIVRHGDLQIRKGPADRAGLGCACGEVWGLAFAQGAKRRARS